MRAKPKQHYKAWRENCKKELEQLIDESRYLAIANLSGLPAKANRDFREVLKKNGFVCSVQNVNVVKKAFEVKKLDILMPYTKGSIMLIFGNENPFKMYRELKNNVSAAPARDGAIAPEDIYVPEGDTGIPPGPALTDFKVAKVDTQIRNGKIYIAKKTLVCEKGNVIDVKIAALLNKLNIKPLKIILDVKGAYDKSDNIFYPLEALNVDMDKLKAQIKVGYLNSLNLAISLTYITNDTIKPLVVKAYKNAKAVALSQNIATKDTIKDLITKAQRIASVLGKKSNIIN